MNKDEVVEKLQKAAVNGKLSCSEAREIMQECNVPAGLLGKICDELGIKIYACELGCF